MDVEFSKHFERDLTLQIRYEKQFFSPFANVRNTLSENMCRHHNILRKKQVVIKHLWYLF